MSSSLGSHYGVAVDVVWGELSHRGFALLLDPKKKIRVSRIPRIQELRPRTDPSGPIEQLLGATEA